MIVYVEENDFHCTLTTMVYKAFWMSYAAIQQGHTPYIHLPRFKSVQSYDDPQMFQQEPNLWNWYFKQPCINGRPQPDEIRTWNTDTNTGLFPLMSQPLAEIRKFYKTNLFFSEAVENRGEALVKKYGIDFSKTIGVTWRGTDIYLDGRPRIPIEKYFKWIDMILKDHPDYRIMCTAEEQEILNPLLKNYPSAFIIDEFESAPLGGKDNPERTSRRPGFERGLQPALMVWLFSKCAHYIKNRSSTGAVASWISNGRIVSLGHDERLGFPANTDTVEIEGKLYPL